jgi:hypothetical protein
MSSLLPAGGENKLSPIAPRLRPGGRFDAEICS